jgi:hypothetical protein
VGQRGVGLAGRKDGFAMLVSVENKKNLLIMTKLLLLIVASTTCETVESVHANRRRIGLQLVSGSTAQ